jgi:hypothetical protein
MDREYTSAGVPDRLTAYLEASPRWRAFRRRAVLARSNGEWGLVCCTVEGSTSECGPAAMPSRAYRQALLYEDSLTAEQCLGFASDLTRGLARFGEIEVMHSLMPSQWYSERVPLNNENLAHPGLIVCHRFGNGGARASVGPLLAPASPYYPDIDHAAHDWLPFPVYHGTSDARNEHVLFLLPETRAFVASVAFSDEGRLAIGVSGTETGKLPLIVKGAYWEEQVIHHAEDVVQDGQAALDVPEDADRLELYLMDSAGVVYDFHREDKWSRLRGDRAALSWTDRTEQDQLRKAVHEGEGSRVEFKPFIDWEKNAPGDRKTKLHEVARTVVAFANADGGRIYLGVEDDCTFSGVDTKLVEWAKASVDEHVVSRYLGTLKTKIKGLVQGDVGLHLSTVKVDGLSVMVIEVAPADPKPISMADCCLYVRIGASNRKVPPEQWGSILKPATLERKF